MNLPFVDINIFIHFLTPHDPVTAQVCLNLLKQAECSEVTLTTSALAITNVVFVLTTLLYPSPRDIKTHDDPPLPSRGLKLPQPKTQLGTLAIFAASRGLMPISLGKMVQLIADLPCRIRQLNNLSGPAENISSPIIATRRRWLSNGSDLVAGDARCQSTLSWR